jgi:hypothetical protein
MGRYAWIWAVGCAAWTFDGIVCSRYTDKRHAELAFLLAALFFVAWLFYRNPRK